MGNGGSDTDDTSVQIVMFDLTRPNSAEEKVFSAKVHGAIGRDENETAVDAMIAAALKDFPGKPHERYTLPTPRMGE